MMCEMCACVTVCERCVYPVRDRARNFIWCDPWLGVQMHDPPRSVDRVL